MELLLIEIKYQWICPAVIYLQENFLKQGDNINIKNYQLFNYI